MNVWVIIGSDCTCCMWNVVGVFTSREKAEAAASESDYRYTEIEECTMDERY